jgi:uncharacterized membrane-anchored protein YhcB (DUF1043 family)
MSELPFDAPVKPRRAVRKKPAPADLPKIGTAETLTLSLEPAGEATAQTSLHTDKLDPLTLWFVAAVAVGTALHLLSAASVPALRMIGWGAPLAISVGYPAFGLWRGWHRTPASREKFADNSYYLGFIFTQVALVVGFVPMTFFNAELGSQDVLRAFSVALGASLIGLVVRTMLVQTGHSVTENADIVENEVEALARAVSRQTQAIVDEFAQLGGRLTQTYAELNTELEGCVGRLAATFKGYEDAVGRDVQSVALATDSVVDATRQANTAVETGASRFASTTASSAKLLDAARDKLKGDLEDAIRTLQQTNNALALSADALGRAPDFSRAVDTLIGRVDGAEAAVTRLETLTVTGEQVVQDAARHNVSTLEVVAAREREDLSARAAAFQTEVETAAQSLESTLKRFREELGRIGG